MKKVYIPSALYLQPKSCYSKRVFMKSWAKPVRMASSTL